MPARRERIRIRRATLRDLDALVHQRRGMWKDIADHTPAELDAADTAYREWARRRLRSGTLVGWVAETPDGRIVSGGAIWLRENQPRPGWEDRLMPYLLSMYTEPESRGKGLATRIVQESVRWAKVQGYRRMTLHASKYGRGVYKRLGWERTWEMRIRLNEPQTKRATRARRRPSGRRARSPR